MKNTYWEVPNEIVEILQECKLYVDKDSPENKRFIKRIDSALEIIDKVKEKNVGEYSIEDVFRCFSSLSDFEDHINDAGLTINYFYRTGMGYCFEIIRAGEIIHHELNLGHEMIQRKAAYCFCFKHLVDNKTIEIPAW